MANIKFVTNNGLESLRAELEKYGRAAGYNTFPHSSAYEFASVQQYWGYDTQSNISVLQFIITDNYIEEICDLPQAASKIAALFADRFQTLLYVTGNIISIAVNPVSFIDGSILITDETWRANFTELADRIIRSSYAAERLL